METTVETIDYRGGEIRVLHDPEPHNPREEHDWHVAVMVCAHSRYTLGDESLTRVPDVLEDEYDGDVAAWLAGEYDAIPGTVVPLYLYDHSGITMSTGTFACDPGGWDSGIVGYAFTTAERLEETGVALEDVPAAIVAEVQEYDDYLTGNVYGYVAAAPDGREVGSCYGIFPSHPETWTGDYLEAQIGWALEEARAEIDAAILEAAGEERRRAYFLPPTGEDLVTMLAGAR